MAIICDICKMEIEPPESFVVIKLCNDKFYLCSGCEESLSVWLKSKECTNIIMKIVMRLQDER